MRRYNALHSPVAAAIGVHLALAAPTMDLSNWSNPHMKSFSRFRRDLLDKNQRQPRRAVPPIVGTGCDSPRWIKTSMTSRTKEVSFRAYAAISAAVHYLCQTSCHQDNTVLLRSKPRAGQFNSIQHGCRWEISVWSTPFDNLNPTATLSLSKLSTSSKNICRLEILTQSLRQSVGVAGTTRSYEARSL